jgi:ATP-dependent DNA helicase DinG
LEAGTGTGKTVAYCLAAIVASELLHKTVIVSTATVALQEQLFFKDLPRLAEIVPDLKFDILKGRARYVCESRLEGAINDEEMTGLLPDELQDGFGGNRWQAAGLPRDRAEALRWFKNASKKLNTNQWDGDIDSLPDPPDPADWQQVQANAHACNGGQCEFFKSCAFFRARRQAATANLQVANHALILATLQTDSTLIDPGNSLFVFDEAHHLPQIAGDQFSYRARIGTSMKLMASLRTLAIRHSRGLSASQRPDPVAFASLISDCTDHLSTLERYWQDAGIVHADQTSHRFPHGRIPDALIPVCAQLSTVLRAITTVVASIAAALMEPDEAKSPAERTEQSRNGVELGVYLSRLGTLEQLFTAWATHDKVPWAKWIEWNAPPKPMGKGGSVTTEANNNAFSNASPDATFCASPMTAAQVLSNTLWKRVSAAVCTSATLTACGSFDFFDRLSGINRYPARQALVVDSPFDYATQGELRIPAMQHNPKSPGFSDELCDKLPALLREHHHGQLVLFTFTPPDDRLLQRPAPRPDGPGANARRQIPHPAPQRPRPARRKRRTQHHLRPAILRRRHRPARRIVRTRPDRQTALHSSQLPRRRSPLRMARRPRPRRLQRTLRPPRRDETRPMVRPRCTHHHRQSRHHRVRHAVGDDAIWARDFGWIAAVSGGSGGWEIGVSAVFL